MAVSLKRTLRRVSECVDRCSWAPDPVKRGVGFIAGKPYWRYLPRRYR